MNVEGRKMIWYKALTQEAQEGRERRKRRMKRKPNVECRMTNDEYRRETISSPQGEGRKRRAVAKAGRPVCVGRARVSALCATCRDLEVGKSGVVKHALSTDLATREAGLKGLCRRIRDRTRLCRHAGLRRRRLGALIGRYGNGNSGDTIRN
jgi:hypothetical protein